ncbi:hypothetical protein K469DRAFT_803168 [Zopfia rhizophila CBS 207.26]|uniref:Uncharacterized protein n=1 Tax=Zopfia rhizophila CBS 207.26 TaxID=1314779 RepID=A0A6A6DJ20_9PEZI|nr:hypothetical protein K469DRAFT_803168 [Zopfia rhizophila CBS 207.26]
MPVTYNTCNTCFEALPASAFARNRNGTRLSSCRTCRNSLRTSPSHSTREQRRRQVQQPLHYFLVQSQPHDTSYCSACGRYRPVSNFWTNRISTPYITCIECSTSTNTDGSRRRLWQSTAADQPPRQRRRNNPVPTPPAAPPAASPATSLAASPAASSAASPATPPAASSTTTPSAPLPSALAPAPAPTTVPLAVRTTPQLVQSFDIGPMTVSCISCSALH